MASRLDFPSLLDSTEQVSADAQKYFFLATGGSLGLLAAGALVALIPAGSYANIGPILTVIFLVAALLLQISGVANRQERKWYAARAAAESIKTSSWEFAVGGEAFRINDQNAETRFREVMKKVLDNVRSLDVGASGIDGSAVTESMRTLRSEDRATRAETYRTLRVDDQIKWYSSKAAHNKSRYRQLGAAVAIVELVAITLGLLRVSGSVDADLLGPATSIAAGFIGWMQAKKYANLAEAYAVTSHEVSLVPSTLSKSESEDEWAQAVHDAEAAFSREHTMWQARRQGPV